MSRLFGDKRWPDYVGEKLWIVDCDGKLVHVFIWALHLILVLVVAELWFRIEIEVLGL